jgi:hypothetical protein
LPPALHAPVVPLAPLAGALAAPGALLLAWASARAPPALRAPGGGVTRPASAALLELFSRSQPKPLRSPASPVPLGRLVAQWGTADFPPLSRRHFHSPVSSFAALALGAHGTHLSAHPVLQGGTLSPSVGRQPMRACVQPVQLGGCPALARPDAALQARPCSQTGQRVAARTSREAAIRRRLWLLLTRAAAPATAFAHSMHTRVTDITEAVSCLWVLCALDAQKALTLDSAQTCLAA